MGSAAFPILAGLLIILGLLALFQLGSLRLQSAHGIMGDGLRRGVVAPKWTGLDLSGSPRGTPSSAARRPWQFLVFADHSLAQFPHTVSGLAALSRDHPEVEILVLPRGEVATSQTADLMRKLGLPLEIVEVTQKLYDQFRVRVMPFGTVIDTEGVVRSCGLISDENGVRDVWRFGRASGVERPLHREDVPR